MRAFGRTEQRGFLFKDGEMRHIAQVDYDLVYDEAKLQKKSDVTVTDTGGRKSHIAFTMFGMLTSSHDTQSCINTGCAMLDFDAKPGVDVCEFAWSKEYFDFAKDLVAKYG